MQSAPDLSSYALTSFTPRPSAKMRTYDDAAVLELLNCHDQAQMLVYLVEFLKQRALE
jgi:uncharacterized protein YqiB (DUF1249 family)